MSTMAEAQRQPDDWASLFPFDAPIFPGVPDGSRICDDVWDVRPIVHFQASPLRTLYLTTVEPAYRMTARELLFCLIQPDNEVVVDAGIVVPAHRSSPGTLQNVVRHLAVMSQWGIESGLNHVSEWTQQDAERFLGAVSAGAFNLDGKPLSANTLRAYVTTLKNLREFSPVLSGGGLPFLPWGAATAATVAGVVRRPENITRPMPLAMWEPLIAAAWSIVDRFSEDIVPAIERKRGLPGTRRAVSGKAAWPALQEWIAAGNPIPLHTGYGVDRNERGGVNLALLARLANVSGTFLKQTHHSYQPDARAEIERIAATGQATFGGLHQPSVLVDTGEGRQQPWISEIGTGEIVYLESVLRGACYIILAALTGMRDSEIQLLRRGCVTEENGLPALTSVQVKGRRGDIGEVRTWWAPRPAIRAVEVLTSISPHPIYLLARSEEDGSTYNPGRDVARVAEFVNANPGERMGRGHGLGLQPIDLTSRIPINQTTLRRSFSVIAAHKPGAELGLGIQLGHVALRMTTGYAMDSTQQTAQLFDEARIEAMRLEAARVLRDVTPAAGMRADEIVQFRGQIASDISRAESIIEAFAETYQIGVFNDCMYQEERAGCGPGGPKLASQHCATSACSNALFLTRHRPNLQAQIDNIDAWLDRGTGHPGVLEQLREERARLVNIVRQLDTDTQGEADAT